MSDDSSFLNFTAAPIPAAQPRQKSLPKTSTKKAAQKRQNTSQSQTVYGEELFQAAYKPTKSLVICFWPFTKNHIRISKDEHKNRFAIKYDPSDGKIWLYHFEPPLDFDAESPEFIKEMEVELPEDRLVNYYGPFDDPVKVKLYLINILRNEVLQDKKKRLEELRAAENLDRAEKERLENEREIIEQQLADTGILADPQQSNLATSENSSAKSENAQKISEETPKEESTEGTKIVKDRSGATLKLKPIVW